MLRIEVRGTQFTAFGETDTGMREIGIYNGPLVLGRLFAAIGKPHQTTTETGRVVLTWQLEPELARKVPLTLADGSGAWPPMSDADAERLGPDEPYE